MNNLGDYLDKFKKIFSGAKFQKDAVVSIVNKATQLQLEPKDIDIKDAKVILNTSPAVKSVVYLRKQKILAELKAQLGNNAPIDIR